MQRQIDIEALTTLPLLKVGCDRHPDKESVSLRDASWSLKRELCRDGAPPCPHYEHCLRVATVHNRPLVSLKVAA